MKNLSIFSAILLMALASGKAQNLPAGSVYAYLSAAQSRASDVQAADARSSWAQEQAKTVRPLPDPILSIEYYPEPLPLANGNVRSSIGVMQMLPPLGERRAMRGQMQSMAAAEQQNAAEQKLMSGMSLAEAWAQLYTLGKTAAQLRQSADLLELIYQSALTTSKYPNSAGSAAPSTAYSPSSSITAPSPSGGMAGMGGAGSSMAAGNTAMPAGNAAMPAASMSGMSSAGSGMLDKLLAIKEEQLMIGNSLAETERSIRLAKLAIEQLSGMPISGLPDSLPLAASLPLTNIPAEIQKNSPMIGMFRADSIAAGFEIKMRQAMRFPMIGIGLSYMDMEAASGHSAMPPMDMYMLMASVTVPIFQGKISREKAALSMKQSEIGFRQKSFSESLARQVQEQLNAAESASQSVELYRKLAELNAQRIEIQQNQIGTGSAGIEALLRSMSKQLEYGRARAQAEASLFKSQLWIQLYAGKLPIK